jgi:uncharacterized protein
MSNHIIVRNRHFQTKAAGIRASVDVEPIAVALYTSLSATFPLGESFFVRSVAYYAKDIPSQLKREVEAFIRQEANHSREHAHFNKGVGEAGLPIDKATDYADGQLGALEKRPPLTRLAVTTGLEHFTSVFAQIILRDPRHLAYCDPDAKALWQWHALEEIEHKAVAFDVFNHVTAHWSPVKRWLFRSAIMVETMARLGFVVWRGIGDVLVSEGQATPGWRLRVMRYLLVSPGLLGAMSAMIARYFLPGFHPNHIDEGDLLATTRAAMDTLRA